MTYAQDPILNDAPAAYPEDAAFMAGAPADTLDPWGNSQNGMMRLQRRWRAAEDLASQYRMTIDALHDQSYVLTQRVKELQNPPAG